MKEVLVTLFEESSSCRDARARIGYLEELTTWDPSYSSRIRAAVRANPKIGRDPAAGAEKQ
jgi:hypothetical protein